MTITKAAKENQIPRRTATTLLRKYRNTGTTHRCSGLGRPPKATESVRRDL